MLTREEDIDVHALRARGWTISAIAQRRASSALKQDGRVRAEAWKYERQPWVASLNRASAH